MIFFLLAAWIPRQALAGNVIKCSPHIRKSCKCAVERIGLVERRDKVIIYNYDNVKVNTGFVERVRDNYFVAKFRGICNLEFGYRAEIMPAALDYAKSRKKKVKRN